MPDFDKALILSGELEIEPEWIDYNGHLNMGYYTVLFDRASDAVFLTLGLGPDYVKAHNKSFYTVECQIRYLAELKLGDPIIATFQLIRFDEKRIHAAQMLYHKDGRLCATAELLWLHVDRKGTLRACPFEQNVISALDHMAQRHAHLPRPDFIGKAIGERF